ncbi:MAG: peptide chain release factor N(5)-glutamine methyltransferase [Christensenellaceae bacterium]|nr:peptide chain release factor N(5)-glutamine methyltransferase [Christensenellaceae bacterium]
MNFLGSTARCGVIKAGEMLSEAGIDDATFDAKQLVAFALGLSRLRPTDYRRILSEEQAKTLEDCIQRRIKREPLQYILGEWEFMGLPFRVRPGVLIPRPDTETLCEAAETLIRRNGYRTLLDICTGSGCIGIALANRCGIHATLADISSVCIETAGENAKLNSVGCTIVQSDLFDGITGSFDLITANPPYIASDIMQNLQEEVRFEPALALDGGEDGLSFYRRIHDTFRPHLNAGGALILEIDYDQGADVTKLFADCGKINMLRDLGGNERVVLVET